MENLIKAIIMELTIGHTVTIIVTATINLVVLFFFTHLKKQISKYMNEVKFMSITIEAIDYGLEKSPSINGNYTKARNEKKNELLEKEEFINNG